MEGYLNQIAQGGRLMFSDSAYTISRVVNLLVPETLDGHVQCGWGGWKGEAS